MVQFGKTHDLRFKKFLCPIIPLIAILDLVMSNADTYSFLKNVSANLNILPTN